MQRVLVTGANRGLGLEFVHQLLARGARVIARVPSTGPRLEAD
jgi:NAD(P)-dependent dehydrogenase (short-subunit alcohol dehydrogenase family)